MPIFVSFTKGKIEIDVKIDQNTRFSGPRPPLDPRNPLINSHRFFFVFQYPGTFPLADSHYGMSELKIPLRTLGLDPDFHVFFTARGDDVRRQIAVQK